MKLSKLIKAKLVELASDDKLPLDMNELDESVFDGIVGDKVKGNLQCLYNDTEMALTDIWDRSDSGFQAQQDILHELAGLLSFELEPYEPEGEDA